MSLCKYCFNVKPRDQVFGFMCSYMYLANCQLTLTYNATSFIFVAKMGVVIRTLAFTREMPIKECKGGHMHVLYCILLTCTGLAIPSVVTGAQLLDKPFQCCILPNFITDESGFLESLKTELLRLKFYEKNNDLYQFHQVSLQHAWVLWE